VTNSLRGSLNPRLRSGQRLQYLGDLMGMGFEVHTAAPGPLSPSAGAAAHSAEFDAELP
jgi:hypothetical protein